MTIGEHVVQQMYVAGAREWPDVRVELSVFREHCQRVLAGNTGKVVALHGADLFLCCGCATKDAAALETLVREATSTAMTAIVRVSRDPGFGRETLQELWRQLLWAPEPKIANYSGRGPLHAWLRVVASRVALGRCRAQRLSAEREIGLAEHFARERSDPAMRTFRSRYGAAFDEALERAVKDLSSADRNLLRLHARHCNVEQIGRIYNVHRATAERWLDRAKGRVLAAARRRLELCTDSNGPN